MRPNDGLRQDPEVLIENLSGNALRSVVRAVGAQNERLRRELDELRSALAGVIEDIESGQHFDALATLERLLGVEDTNTKDAT